MWLDIHVHTEARYYFPYLDGKKLENCFAANEEEGWADVHEIDDDGYTLVIKDKSGNILREQRIEKGSNTLLLAEGEESYIKTKRLFGKVELKKIE